MGVCPLGEGEMFARGREYCSDISLKRIKWIVFMIRLLSFRCTSKRHNQNKADSTATKNRVLSNLLVQGWIYE